MKLISALSKIFQHHLVHKMMRNLYQPIFLPKDTIGEFEIKSSLNYQTRNQTYKAFNPKSGKEYFIKIREYETFNDISNIYCEMQVLDQLKDNYFILNHTHNIIKEINVKKDIENGEIKEHQKTFMITIMPYYNCPNLQSFFYKNVIKLHKPEIKPQIFYKILLILENIHDKRIVHHDIKPENFLVRNQDPLDIILTDFEFSVQLRENEKIKCLCGTLQYMAPEILKIQDHDMAADIWSLGVMIYSFSRYVLPFKISKDDDINAIKEKITTKKLSFGKKFSRSLGNLLYKMLEVDPSKRISAKEALNHPFFKEFPSLIELKNEEVGNSII